MEKTTGTLRDREGTYGPINSIKYTFFQYL